MLTAHPLDDSAVPDGDTILDMMDWLTEDSLVIHRALDCDIPHTDAVDGVCWCHPLTIEPREHPYGFRELEDLLRAYLTDH